MLEKIRELPRLFFLIGILLYFFGFISLNSFLSRFGIANFDILNSRFIFAGIFAVVAIAVALLVAWTLAKEMPLRLLFNVKSAPFSQRLSRYNRIWVTYGVSLLLTELMSLGKMSQRGTEVDLAFSPLFGAHDFIAKHLCGSSFGFAGGLGYAIKAFVNVFPYFVMMGGLIYAFLFVKERKYPKKTPEGEDGSKPVGQPLKQEKAYVPSKIDYSYVVLDFAIFWFFLALGWYCYKRLATHIVDFTTFSEDFNLTGNMMFTWLFPNVCLFYLFLNAKFDRNSFSSLSSIARTESLNSLVDLVRQSFLPAVAALITFGQVIFPRIPFAIGGGQPRQVIVTTTDKLQFGSGRVFLLGESSQFVYLVDINEKVQKAYQINKNQILSVQTR